MAESTAKPGAVPDEAGRRDFLRILAMAGGAVGAASVVWPLIDALNPGAAGEAQARPVITVSDIPENSAKKIYWAGMPVLIRRLTDQQIADAEVVAMTDLPDPAELSARVAPGNGHFVVVVGLNTGIPCELEGNSPSGPHGHYDGWICPCDGSQYDVLGRVRSGPAKRNLPIPRFAFIDDAQIQLG
ncbi:MAG: ubiquinol-cytochrome c reductase iron-sulfur subunit [Rhodospirillales bacterium]|nr:ubiquinol-cytochrome c reductase iron-sulfur subunit [Rhodospirillales bacterium]MDE1883058.1 ubiquinol-cytochrome c reductase iron-sulfur subunit [Rhodospirillales bacterium]MDE2390709.1 ubiquinol-cytochrome c reductase iron-sulfur subunit [Rhodospirillales bacterium]MDE2458297.1 ubiquinol-cytochrome c reductase iron-sulfur subunit [Rhodospirillales bacterium]